MNLRNPLKAAPIALSLPLLLLADISPEAPLGLTLGREAAAIIGRPLTPMSYAGVARRTTARVDDHEAVAVSSAAAASTAAATSQRRHSSRRSRNSRPRRRSSRRRSRNNRRRSPSSRRRLPGRRHRHGRAGAARGMRGRREGWRRVLPVRHRLVPRGIPGQQPRLRHRGAAVIRNEAHRMNKGSIRAALGVAVLAALASLPHGAHARDPGLNQPGRRAIVAWQGQAWVRLVSVPATPASTSRARRATRRGRARRGCARRRRPRPRHQPARRDGQPRRRGARRGRARRRGGGSRAQPAWRRRKRRRRGPAFGQAVAARRIPKVTIDVK